MAKKQKQVRASWDWVAPWSDETENVRALALALQEFAIRAATLPSPYVGHRLLAVHPADTDAAVQALKQLGESYIAGTFRDAVAKRKGKR